jgi:membrane-associated phospholipid phosphatase
MYTAPSHRTMLTWIILITLCGLLFIIWLVFISRNSHFDETVFTAIAPYITDTRTAWMKSISMLGNHKLLIPANFTFIVYLLSRKKNKAAITAAVVALSSLGLMSLMKNTIARQRPDGPLVDGIVNFGFPSGHAFMSVAFYGLLLCWINMNVEKKWQVVAAAILLPGLILLISFSRIYLRVHYTTDVIAGLCIGTGWLLICLLGMAYLQRKKD